MIYRIKEYSILKVLFLIYFFFFAISPLSYSRAEEQLNEPTLGQTEAYSKNYGLLFLELLRSKITQKENQEEDSSPVRFLLLKKRAILPSNSLINALTPIKDYALKSSHIVLSEIFFITLIAQNSEPESFKGFHFSYSGLSPPSY
ncbi:MAG: hypothetical protein AB1480_06075 [Nitrospirota bacterium]